MQGRAKFIVGGVILLAAVVYLIATNLVGQQEYFITVDTLQKNQSEYVNRSARISGVVIGDTISYDGHTLKFVIANVPDSIQQVKDDGGFAEMLHQAAIDSKAAKITVILTDQPKPDLLKNEAQAIVTGKLGSDGIFYADELLLKCPTRYQNDVPNQAGG